MRLLLDTCTFLWLIGFPERLPDAIRASLEDGETNCAVSPATLWECLIKHGKGRLHFQIGERNSVLDFLLWQCEQHELDVLPIDAGTLRPLEHLPPLHSDPFDRLLISHAIEDGRAIVTPDPLIRSYPKGKRCQVYFCLFLAGYPYHIVQRGHDRQPVFSCDEDSAFHIAAKIDSAP